MPRRSSHKPSRVTCMLTKCWDCSGFYADGREDCEVTSCPLYPYMPYAKLTPDLSWAKFNPRRQGEVLKKDNKDEEENVAEE